MGSITGFVTREEAGLRKPKSVSRNIDASKGGVAIHWGGPAQNIKSHDECVKTWRAWQAYHMNGRGWVDIAYSMGFCNHGYAFAGRGAGVRTAANGTNTANGAYYAAVFIGGKGDELTDEAISAMWWCIDALRKEGKAADKVKPHSAFRSTSCCGDELRAAITAGPTKAKTTTKKTTTKKTSTKTKNWTEKIVEELPVLKKRTNLRTASDDDRRAQGLLAAAGVLEIEPNLDGKKFDGKFGSSTEKAVKAFQKSKKLSDDGIIGEKTWTALLGG